MADITLSSAVRSNLLSLQSTTQLIDRTQTRLSTGLKISSPSDDAVKFFQAKGLNSRASDLNDRKAAIDQGISALDTALKAADALEDLAKQMKGVLDSARSGTDAQRKEYSEQLIDLALQIEKLVGDATYQGLNLLSSTAAKLSVRFSDKADSKLEVDGVDFNASSFFMKSSGTALGLVDFSADNASIASLVGFEQAMSAFQFSVAVQLASFNAQADDAVARLDETISNLQSKASTLANNVAVLKVRSDFTKEYVNVLETGSGKLVNADLNSEGANLLALQTRQQLGIQALSFAGQAEQSILGLFR
ncbi:MAG: flagellin [Rhodospirillales bacterium]|nr:flagellin [Rhodospirillales bacterium]